LYCSTIQYVFSIRICTAVRIFGSEYCSIYGVYTTGYTALRFRRALEELRVYQVSQQSWQLLNTRVQNQLTHDEVESFDDALRLYFRREEVRIYNHRRLRDCKQPILKIRSTHTGRVAEGANDGEGDGLEPHLCICLGARVMLTDNIWVENGLVNGSMGTVRDIVWNEGQDPIKDMPTAIMVEVNDYDGPKFLGTNYIPIFRHQAIRIQKT
jgi:ATP-dependent DNA helicase PIF1